MSGWASLDELERHIEKLRAAKKQGTRATLRAGVFAAAEHFWDAAHFSVSVRLAGRFRRLLLMAGRRHLLLFTSL